MIIDILLLLSKHIRDHGKPHAIAGRNNIGLQFWSLPRVFISARLHTSKVTLDISGRPIESQPKVTRIDMKLVDRLCHTETEGTAKSFWQGCAAQVFDRIPLAKENLVESILLAKDNFLIMSPFLRDFKEF